MITSDPETLTGLLFVAAGAGVVHTLAGPDHYLPLVAVGRAREWSALRLGLVTAGVGLVHCVASAALVLALFVSSSAIPVWLGGAAQFAAWSMIAAGIVFGVGAWRQRRSPSRSSTATRPAMALVAVAFLVGPCEWLVPVALTAGHTQGLAGALLVSATYTACTVATMVVAAVVGVFGLRRITRHREWLAPVACTACGLLMLVGF